MESFLKETAYEYCHETGGTVVSNHRLRKLTNRKENSGPVISFFEYTYDEVGNRLTMGELRGTNTYTYDNLYRLKTVAYPDNRDVTYTYDDAGNRVSMVENVMDLVTRQYSQHTTTYTYDNANQMLTSTKDSVTTNYAWDLNGNQGTKTTGSTAMTCVWNGKDEMTGIYYSGSKPSNSMTYNGDGKRVEYVSSEGTQRYVYEGNGTILETDETATITKKYNSGISMEIPAREGVTCKQQYFYLCDGLGSVVNLMDDGGNIVQVYYYDAFGKSTNVKHDPTNKKQFTGKEIDEDSGLQYFLARYYDPEIGRFLSEDPSPDINLYVYCSNNAVNKVDPDGREEIKAGKYTLVKHPGDVHPPEHYHVLKGDKLITKIKVESGEAMKGFENLSNNTWKKVIKAAAKNGVDLTKKIGGIGKGAAKIGGAVVGIIIATEEFGYGSDPAYKYKDSNLNVIQQLELEYEQEQQKEKEQRENKKKEEEENKQKEKKIVPSS